MKSHLSEESPAAIFLLRFAFYLVPTYFQGPVLKHRYFFVPPCAALTSPPSRWHHTEEQRSVVINRIYIIFLPPLRLKSKMQLS